MNASSAFTENGLVFRQIKKEEVLLFTDLYAASFPDKASFLPFEMEIVNEKDSYAAFDGDLPVAMVTANPVVFRGKRGHQIFKLCAHRDYRGKGVAAALVAFMHEAQRRRGDVFSLVMPGGEKLYAFYEKCGYLPIAARKVHFLPGDGIALSGDPVTYTDRYKDYCQKSAAGKRKIAADEKGALLGLHEEGILLVDDCFERTAVCQRACALYLPDKTGTERYGMVCSLEDGADVEGILISLVNGFH